MKRYLILSLLSILYLNLHSQTSGDNTIKIASSLEPSDAIVREDETIIDVKSESFYTEKDRYVITLNNSNASKFLNLHYWFDKSHKYKAIQVRLLNSLGLELKKFSKKDFSVFAGSDGISITNDYNVMQLKVPAREYPCTLEVETEMDANGFITLPDWVAASNTLSMSYTLITPSNFKIRYRVLNMTL